MRRLSSLPLILLAAYAVGQTKFPNKYTQTLYLDHLTGALYHERYDGALEATGHSPSIGHNAPVQLKLINVNTYRYRIRVRVHGENLFTSAPPALFTNSGFLGAPSHETLADSTISEFASPSTSRDLEDTRKVSPALAARLSDLATKLDTLQNDLDAIGELSTLDETLLDLARSAPDPTLAPGVKDPRDPELKVLQQFRGALQTHVGNIVNAGSNASSEPAFSRDVQAAPPALLGNQFVVLAEKRVSKAEDALTDIEDDVKAITQNVQTQSTSLASRDLPADAKAANADLLEKLSKHVARAYDRVQRAVASLNDDRTAAERRNHELRAAKIYERLMTENFYEAKSFITTPEADVLVYDIDVSETGAPDAGALSANSGPVSRDLTDRPAQSSDAPQTTGDSQGSFVQHQRVPVYVTGTTKVDFSTGLVFSGLSDDNYTTRQQGSQFVLVRGAHDQFHANPAALMHLYRTSSNGISPALTFGLGQGANSDLQYYLGGSLLMGQSQRVILTGGITGARVQRLNGLSPNDILNAPPTGNLTTAVFRTGYFFGLSFNLGR